MSASALFPVEDARKAHAAGTGILPYQTIQQMIRAGEIRAARDIDAGQVQPASIDLRLGDHAYRVRASFLPGKGATVAEKLAEFEAVRIDLSDGAILEKGSVYIVPLMEHLSLKADISGLCNPKSSTGRLNIFTRVITDNAIEFERIRRGYKGPLYAEISPCAFSIVVRAGSRLNQLRLRRGAPLATRAALERLMEETALVDRPPDADALGRGALPLTADLAGDAETGLVGYRAKTHTGLIDVDNVGGYATDEFWERVYASKRRNLILDPDDFYILASKETVSVPPDHAAEMVAYDTLENEVRRAHGEPARYRWLRPRTVLYAGLIAVVGVAMLAALLLRSDLDLTVERDRNPVYVLLSDGMIRNGYTLKAINKTYAKRTLTLALDGLPGAHVAIVGSDVGDTATFTVEPDKLRSVRVYVRAPAGTLAHEATPIRFTVRDAAGSATVSSALQGPKR